jgi:hypothetical protein
MCKGQVGHALRSIGPRHWDGLHWDAVVLAARTGSIGLVDDDPRVRREYRLDVAKTNVRLAYPYSIRLINVRTKKLIAIIMNHMIWI